MNKTTLVAASLTLFSSIAMADCTAPDQPVLPDGAQATMEAMLAGQKAVKSFQTSNIEYMKCLEGIIAEAEKTLKEASDADKKSYTDMVDAYNSAVSKEEEVAGQFNTEIREYKAANPS
jgi:hypothetical protein